ncbi:MAG: hypothetical protein WCC60_24520, partial [Ilumatobacteraceae bacterium]
VRIVRVGRVRMVRIVRVGRVLMATVRVVPVGSGVILDRTPASIVKAVADPIGQLARVSNGR